MDSSTSQTNSPDSDEEFYDAQSGEDPDTHASSPSSSSAESPKLSAEQVQVRIFGLHPSFQHEYLELKCWDEVLLDDAEGLKQEGNGHFRGGRWEEALATYRMALGRVPKRPIEPKGKE